MLNAEGSFLWGRKGGQGGGGGGEVVCLPSFERNSVARGGWGVGPHCL